MDDKKEAQNYKNLPNGFKTAWQLYMEALFYEKYREKFTILSDTTIELQLKKEFGLE